MGGAIPHWHLVRNIVILLLSDGISCSNVTEWVTVKNVLLQQNSTLVSQGRSSQVLYWEHCVSKCERLVHRKHKILGHLQMSAHFVYFDQSLLLHAQVTCHQLLVQVTALSWWMLFWTFEALIYSVWFREITWKIANQITCTGAQQALVQVGSHLLK